MEFIPTEYTEEEKQLAKYNYEEFCKRTRHKKMLTVGVLIEYLKTLNPNACILGFEPNSNAWIEQFREIPNQYIQTIAEEKISERESLKQWFVGCEDAEEKIEEEMKEIFRYANDDDVIMRF